VRAAQPDEVYHLAAQSFVGTSFDQPISTAEITGLGVTRILEALRETNPNAKFYQASSSELYGDHHLEAQSELTPFRPVSPYATAKLYGYWMTKIYRDGYGLFACNGILFNHESPLRGLEFVTRKVTNAVARISLGLQEDLQLGNLEARRDWGYAPEYVESMWMMLQQSEPDDYVVATNDTHSVGELAQLAFSLVGLDWEKYVKIDERFKRLLDITSLQGDYTKTKNKLGWEPKTDFKGLVEIMVNEDVKRWRQYLNGERFPWDAANHPGESKILSGLLALERTKHARNG
jgi:GDPmannose 4,6-dehydratase